MRVALAAICRNFFHNFGITVGSHVIRIGGVDAAADLANYSADDIRERADLSPVRCLDKSAEAKMMSRIDEAIEKKDTVGGMFEVVVDGLPVGIGSYVHFDRRLDGILAQAMLSIHAMKAVGFGMGEDVSVKFGSDVHDRKFASDRSNVKRTTNNAGGTEGGMSNGERLRIRVSMKPLSSLMQPLESVDMATGKPVEALRERSDVCAVPAAAVVGEAMTLLALMNPFLEKFGGDSMKEILAHVKATPALPWS
jgi:chorismate synthase